MKASAARDLDPIAIKHLEFLQVVINRLSQEMFVYKGWAVTLVAATFAVAAGSGNPLIVAIAMVPAFAFWGLGTMTLRDQRMYRAMYDAVRDGSLLHVVELGHTEVAPRSTAAGASAQARPNPYGLGRSERLPDTRRVASSAWISSISRDCASSDCPPE